MQPNKTLKWCKKLLFKIVQKLAACLNHFVGWKMTMELNKSQYWSEKTALHLFTSSA